MLAFERKLTATQPEVRVVCDVIQERKRERVKKSEFTSISHDLRNTLHSIRGFSKLMLEGQAPLPETHREFLTIIDRECQHLSRLIDELLDVSHSEAGRSDIQKRRLAIRDLTRNAIRGLRFLIRRMNRWGTR